MGTRNIWNHGAKLGIHRTNFKILKHLVHARKKTMGREKALHAKKVK